MRAVFGVGACYVFPQGVLIAITLIEGMAGDGGASTGWEVELPLCSVSVNTMSVAGFSFYPSVSFFPHWGFFALKEGSVQASGVHALTKVQCSLCISTCGSAQRKFMVAFFSLLWVFQI